MITHNLWDLFHANFKIGNEIIIIDSDDDVIVGKLVSVSENGIRLKTVFSGREIGREWVDIRFLGNDGFPVRKLMGADGSESIIEEFKKGKNAAEIIRAATCEELKTSDNKYTPPTRKPRTVATQVRRFVGGCPWMIDECEAVIVNPGCAFEPEHWSLWDKEYDTPTGLNDTNWEEALMLTAPNGAKAELYELSSVFHFEEAS